MFGFAYAVKKLKSADRRLQTYLGQLDAGAQHHVQYGAEVCVFLVVCLHNAFKLPEYLHSHGGKPVRYQVPEML